MPALCNTRHERFAQLIAAGSLDQTETYLQCYPKTKRAGATASGARLLNQVKCRVHELKQASATSTTLTMQERREIAATIARDKQCQPQVRLAALMSGAKLAGDIPDSDANAYRRKVADEKSIIVNLPAIFAQDRHAPRQIEAKSLPSLTNGEAKQG